MTDLSIAAAVSVHKIALEYASKYNMRDDLCGLCLISSISLSKILKKLGYNPIVKCGKAVLENETYSHVWVEVGDRVYDPTFLQFDKKNPVYVGKSTDIHKTFSKYEILKTRNNFLHWSEPQQPLRKRIDWFMRRLNKKYVSYIQRPNNT